MTEPLKALIEALRQELKQYGEMLARLDMQQDSIMRRAAEDILASVTSVQDQGGVIQQARRAREKTQRQLASSLQKSELSSLAQLTEAMPPDYRPLARALVEENNELLVRVQQRARQNHLLLRRSLDLMQDLMGSLFPAGQVALYDGHGNSAGRRLPACALYDAAG
jgi:hypothetical protein